MNYPYTFGFIIGYFVLGTPLNLIRSWGIIDALIHSILGVTIAILILWVEKK